MPNQELKEIKVHGSALFPMDVYSLKKDESEYNNLYCHWHEEFEIIFVTEGGGEFHIGDKSFPVYAGEAVCVNRNELHAAVSLKNLPCHYSAIVFNPSILTGMAGDLIQNNYVNPVLNGEIVLPNHITAHEDWGRSVLSSLQTIMNCFAVKKDGFELLAKAELYMIWYHLYSHAERIKSARPKKDERKTLKIKTVLEYIHRNYPKDIKLSELASLAELSEGQFCRFFRSAVKMSAINYLNYYRISQSALMLSDKSRKIGEIACAVGFNNISYFNKEFRRYMHYSPSAYRRAEYLCK